VPAAYYLFHIHDLITRFQHVLGQVVSGESGAGWVIIDFWIWFQNVPGREEREGEKKGAGE
jgi:hypothetical protein